MCKTLGEGMFFLAEFLFIFVRSLQRALRFRIFYCCAPLVCSCLRQVYFMFLAAWSLLARGFYWWGRQAGAI